MSLSGLEQAKLSKRLLEATKPGRITLWVDRIALLATELNLPLTYINWNTSPGGVAFSVVQYANSQEKVGELIEKIEALEKESSVGTNSVGEPMKEHLLTLGALIVRNGETTNEYFDFIVSGPLTYANIFKVKAELRERLHVGKAHVRIGIVNIMALDPDDTKGEFTFDFSRHDSY